MWFCKTHTIACWAQLCMLTRIPETSHQVGPACACAFQQMAAAYVVHNQLHLLPAEDLWSVPCWAHLQGGPDTWWSRHPTAHWLPCRACRASFQAPLGLKHLCRITTLHYSNICGAGIEAIAGSRLCTQCPAAWTAVLAGTAELKRLLTPPDRAQLPKRQRRLQAVSMQNLPDRFTCKG